jgi:hypothetical protein
MNRGTQQRVPDERAATTTAKVSYDETPIALSYTPHTPEPANSPGKKRLTNRPLPSYQLKLQTAPNSPLTPAILLGKM